MEFGRKRAREGFLKIRWVAIFWAGVLCLSGTVSSTLAQEPPQALQDRVQDFYALLQAGRWTQAEAYFTEDSKEQFRSSPKTPPAGFQVKSIKLDPDGQGASAVVQVLHFTPFSGSPMPFSQTTQWRLVKGVWYVELAKPDPDQFKKLFGGGGERPGIAQPPPAAAEELKFKGHLYRLGNLFAGQVKTARFPFTNVTDHEVTITSVDLVSKLLHSKMEKKVYKPGESGELAVEFDPGDFQGDFGQTILVTTDPGHLTTKLTILGSVAFHQQGSPPKSGPPPEPKPNQ